MASVVYTEAKVHNDRRPLSLCLDAPPSSSPFPSPSSSFLPPPMPGAHEFAIKPAPAGRNSRKTSIAPKEDEARPLYATMTPTVHAFHLNGTSTPLQEPESTLSPVVTPTPSILQRQSLLPNTVHQPLSSPSAATTPTPSNAPLPRLPTWEALSASTATTPASALHQAPRTPTTPCSPAFYPPPSPSTSAALDASGLTSNRPAPPSPDVSRRASAVPSNASGRSRSSRSSRPPSTAVSRANSMRKPTNQNRLSVQFNTKSTPLHTSSPLPSPHSPSSSSSLAFQPPGTQTHTRTTQATTPPRTLVHVRDYAYAPADPRFSGLGPDVPRANKVARMNRRLRVSVVGSEYESSEDGGDAEDEDNENENENAGVDEQWDMLKFGVGRFSSWNAKFGISAGGPSQGEMDMNFGAGGGEVEEEEEEDVYYEEVEGGDGGEGEGEGEEEPLFPGLYRALYAFDPEGTAEMALEEDQIVRVVGRGGGVGWAVVVHEQEGMVEKHALVPESYLEVIRLDWEEEEVAIVAERD